MGLSVSLAVMSDSLELRFRLAQTNWEGLSSRFVLQPLLIQDGTLHPVWILGSAHGPEVHHLSEFRLVRLCECCQSAVLAPILGAAASTNRRVAI